MVQWFILRILTTRFIKKAFKEDESLILLSPNDVIEVTYEPMDDGIHMLDSYKNIMQPSASPDPKTQS